MKVLTYQRLCRHKRFSELLLCRKQDGSGIHRLDTFLPESMMGSEGSIAVSIWRCIPPSDYYRVSMRATAHYVVSPDTYDIR
jgi:hypothetical protein